MIQLTQARYDELLATEAKLRAEGVQAGDERALPTSTAGRDPIFHAVASLAAAISLLERTPNTKKAAASDKMFAQMLADYRVALENARAALTSAPVADESPMAKMADALREKGRQEQQAYQDRRAQSTEWGPMPHGTEADLPASAPVAGEYISAMGEAAQAYLDSFPYAHKLPAQFRWADLWDAMRNAAPQASEDARKSVEYVVKTFKDSEAAGYHTKDRQFAISILEQALKDWNK